MRIDMHDYTSQAKAYWWLTFLLGAWAIARASADALAQGPVEMFVLMFGASFAALAGVFAARIPGMRTAAGAAELVLFLLLIELGPAAATLAAAAEAASISWRTSKRATSRLGSPAMAGLAMYACGSAFAHVRGLLPAQIAPNLEADFVTLLVFALVYFAANALLMTTLIRLKRDEPLQPLSILWSHRWLALVYMACASLALLTHKLFVNVSVSSLLAAAPLIAIFVSMLHVYFKRAEERERYQAERIASAERAAADAARHVHELQESEQRFQSAFAHAAVGMALAATDGRIVQANSELERLLGLEEGALTGAALDAVFNAQERAVVMDEVARMRRGEERAFVVELGCLHTSGVEVVAIVSGSLFEIAQSQCVVLQFQDVTDRRRAEARLQYIANHDSLTDLANRNRFMDALTEAVDAARTRPDCRFAVLFLDCDRFKLVNDSLGHGAGDSLLRGVARRLASKLGPADIVARFGGDEFAILVRDAHADQNAVHLARQIQDAIREPIRVNDVAITTSASIGITTSAFGYDSPDQVIRDADTAMYRAKALGKARFAVFDKALHSEVADRLWLEAELRHAVMHEGLKLAYQPIFDCATRELVAFEALTRWQHPQRGNIPPDVFIRIAEETGLIIPLGTWVLRAACATLGAWCALDRHAVRLAMHVNVSGAQLAQPDFPTVVRGAIASAGIAPHQLVIEITESVLVEKRSIATAHLEDLRALGAVVSIDDFGTGYSSFSMLHQLPVDEIKIDRSFVDRLGKGDAADAVVRTMLSLGTTLGKTMVAEGIETEDQLARLVAMGCDQAQGYLLGRPVPLHDADALVERTLRAPYPSDCLPRTAPVARRPARRLATALDAD